VTEIFTNDEWQAIVEVIPPGKDLEQARRELTECIRDYRGLRLPRAKVKVAQKRAERRDKLATKVAAEWPEQEPQKRAQVNARAQLEGLSMLTRSIKGKKDPARDWLYWRLMAIWKDCFGMALTTTSRGPLVRFLVAAVGVATGKVPNAATMRTVVRRARHPVPVVVHRERRQGYRANQTPKNEF
jgi:hypothetical protein